MSYCKICGSEVGITCICGFCDNCIQTYTHKGCYDRLNCEKSESAEIGTREK